MGQLSTDTWEFADMDLDMRPKNLQSSARGHHMAPISFIQSFTIAMKGLFKGLIIWD